MEQLLAFVCHLKLIRLVDQSEFRETRLDFHEVVASNCIIVRIPVFQLFFITDLLFNQFL